MNNPAGRRVAAAVAGLMFISLMPRIAAAQPTGSAIESLVQRALATAPGLEAVRAEVRAAEGERAQAALRPNPLASLDRRERFGGLDNQTIVGVTLPLDLFRKAARVALADEVVERSRRLVEDAELERARLVRARAAGVLATRRQLDVVTQIAQAARSRFELLAARAESGAGRPLDRDLADVEWRRADAERLQWAAAVEVATAGLRAAVGETIDVDRTLSLSLEAEVALLVALPLPAIGDGLDARPDLRALAADRAIADAARAVAVSEGRWNLSVSAAYMRRTVAIDSGREGMHEGMVGVMVDLPWRNRRQGDIAAAEASRRAATAVLTQRRIEAGAEVDAAVARERAAAETVARYQGGWIALARRNLDVMRETWSLGDATLFDVIDEERRFLSLQTEYTTAMRDLIDARAELRRVTGGR